MDVSYGNLAPFERELALLDEMRGKRVLDVGCGGGHNAVACARQGARVTGIDSSAAQVAAAHRLAAVEGVKVTWVQVDAVEFRGPPSGFDLILAIQLLQYVDPVGHVLATCADLLHDEGTLIASIDHPLRSCFLDPEGGELMPYPVRGYDEAAILDWEFAPGMPMRSRHWPLGKWIEAFVEAGLTVTQVVEPLAPPEVCDELWPEDGPLAPLRLIPHTAILVAVHMFAD